MHNIQLVNSPFFYVILGTWELWEPAWNRLRFHSYCSVLRLKRVKEKRGLTTETMAWKLSDCQGWNGSPLEWSPRAPSGPLPQSMGEVLPAWGRCDDFGLSDALVFLSSCHLLFLSYLPIFPLIISFPFSSSFPFLSSLPCSFISATTGSWGPWQYPCMKYLEKFSGERVSDPRNHDVF